MKPREFDDLVRRKFDEGGFEYKAQNWDRLAEKLDGNQERRSIAIWLMPLIGIAASVVLAMGVPAILNQGGSINQHAEAKYAMVADAQTNPVTTDNTMAPEIAMSQTPVTTIAKKQVHNNTPVSNLAVSVAPAEAESLLADNAEPETVTKTAVATNNIFKSTFKNKAALKDFNNAIGTFAAKDEVKKNKKVPRNIGFYTFKETPAGNTVPKIAVSVLGGVNYGMQANGFIVGATARRMINDKVYVEGDLAFLGSANSSRYSEMDYSDNSSPVSGTIPTAKSAPISNSGSISYSNSYASSVGTTHSIYTAARGAGVATEKSTSDVPVVAPPVAQGHLKVIEKNYNLYYAQITPTVGYKLMKRMSIGIGPDFQQMLVDNRPAASPDETGNIQEAPMFDIGFMGKTEYAISKNVRAAVYYREGINNIITPMNKYIDRNYVQFQIKCAILNR